MVRICCENACNGANQSPARWLYNLLKYINNFERIGPRPSRLDLAKFVRRNISDCRCRFGTGRTNRPCIRVTKPSLRFPPAVRQARSRLFVYRGRRLVQR